METSSKLSELKLSIKMVRFKLLRHLMMAMTSRLTNLSKPKEPRSQLLLITTFSGTKKIYSLPAPVTTSLQATRQRKTKRRSQNKKQNRRKQIKKRKITKIRNPKHD